MTDFANIATGAARLYTDAVPQIIAAFIDVPISYYSTCLALNTLLTLMIATRLFLHHRNIQNVVGNGDSSSRTYTTIITIIVESCALYAATLLLYIVPWALDSYVLYISEGKGAIQVRVIFIYPTYMMLIVIV